ncbi:MAG: PAS domain-containing protein [Candidatus Glassbacteria bacterium]
MSANKLIHLIRNRKHSLEKGVMKTIGDSVPQGLPLSSLINAFLSCLTTMLLSGKKVVTDEKCRLSWDLPELPSLGTIHRIMLAIKKEIITMLERELDGMPHLLVGAICELEDSMDAMLSFMLESESPFQQTDLMRIGEILSSEYSDDIICIYDRDGRLLYISQSIERVLGYTDEEWKQKGPSLMIKNPVCEVIKTDSQETGSFENVKYMVVIPSKSGDEKVIEVEEKFVKGTNGEVLGLWSRMHDVSERESLKQELRSASQRYEEIFEEAADFIFIMDDGGKLESVNRRLRELTGFSSEYLRGKSLETLIHELDRDLYSKEMEKVLNGKTVEFEARMFSASGSYITASFRCNPLHNQKKRSGIIGIARDITDKKRIEEELKKKMELLERFRKASTDRELRIKELLRQLERTGGGET